MPALSGSVAELRRMLGRRTFDLSPATQRAYVAYYALHLAAATKAERGVMGACTGELGSA